VTFLNNDTDYNRQRTYLFCLSWFNMSIWQTFQHLSFVNALSIISISKLFGTKSFIFLSFHVWLIKTEKNDIQNCTTVTLISSIVFFFLFHEGQFSKKQKKTNEGKSELWKYLYISCAVKPALCDLSREQWNRVTVSLLLP
jgi:hypothetical protein